jgi:hypothetical protein
MLWHMFTRLRLKLGLLRATPLPPWRKVGIFAVGGLSEVGFVEGTDYLLVLSANGRGLFDCKTGMRVARDDDFDFAFDRGEMRAEGIGPLAGQSIRVAGLRGGALPIETRDGWKIRHIRPGKRDEKLCLTALRAARESATLFTNVCEFRAFGFSAGGDILVIASSADCTIFRRSPQAGLA